MRLLAVGLCWQYKRTNRLQERVECPMVVLDGTRDILTFAFNLKTSWRRYTTKEVRRHATVLLRSCG